MEIKTKYVRNKKQAVEIAERIKSETGRYPYVRKVNASEWGYGIKYLVEYQVRSNGDMTNSKGSKELVIAH